MRPAIAQMQPEQVRTTAQARAIVEERGLQHVKVGVFDNDGILRGKYIDRDKFLSALDKGMGFCDVVLGWDSNDQQYDNVSFTGWHTAFPDAQVRLLPAPAAHCRWKATCCCSWGSSQAEPSRSALGRSLRRVLDSARRSSA
jgi:glutamine synthetase